MLKVLGGWINRYFGEEETVLLAVLLISALVVLITLGQIIAPFIAALIFAFLLQGGVNRLTLLGIPRIVAVISVFLFFSNFNYFFTTDRPTIIKFSGKDSCYG